MTRVSGRRNGRCDARTGIMPAAGRHVSRHVPGSPLVCAALRASENLAMPCRILHHRDRELRLKRPQALRLRGRNKLATRLRPDDRRTTTLDRLLHQLRERQPRSIRVARRRGILIRDESRRLDPPRRLLALRRNAAAKLRPRDHLRIAPAPSSLAAPPLARASTTRSRRLLRPHQAQRRPARAARSGRSQRRLRGWLGGWLRGFHLPKGTTCAAKRNQSPAFGGGTFQSVPFPGRSSIGQPAENRFAQPRPAQIP